MSESIELLDVVALNRDLPERNLCKGQVGTVVETLASDVYEVEFSNDNGETYASLALSEKELIVLHYEPLEVI